MTDREDLLALLRSRTPIVTLETTDEPSLDDLVRSAATDLRLPLYRWTVTEGLQRIAQGYAPQTHNRRPQDVLAHIKAVTTPGIFLLLDFCPYLDQPETVRHLKDVALLAESRQQTLLLAGHRCDLPAELAPFTANLRLRPPSKEQLRDILRDEAGAWQQQNGTPVRAARAHFDTLLRHLGGLPLVQARRLARLAIHDDGAIDEKDIHRVLAEKFRLLAQSGVLEFHPETAGFADIGGLARFKDWIRQREGMLDPAHRPGNLPAPRGVLLLGVQGGGKSLAAKVVAGLWRVPLLRLDFGAIYQKYIGESERSLREALAAAEAMAPCVLWLDEIEKGLAADSEDGGVSRRVLGTLLTWMAERDGGVFLAATANRIDMLPPELLRKGRFDEIFFIDLPTAVVRRDIFRIHLQRRALDPKAFDLDALAAASDGFTGAEIEQAIVAGLYSTIGGSGKLDQAHLVAELRQTRPLSVLMAEDMAHLRAWAAERTVPAD